MKVKLNLDLVKEAQARLEGVVTKTPLEYSKRLSDKFEANIYLKREDLQLVRSYKLRGAYNKISQLSMKERKAGIVCASAGNHAQGVAFSCNKMNIFGYIYMPKNTPKQKVDRVRTLGGKWVKVELIGETFDESYKYAYKYCKKNKKIFVHPFDDILVMAGQGTVGCEVMDQINVPLDYIIVPVGGGGLLAGLGTYIKSVSPITKVVGVEPEGAPSMSQAIKNQKVITLDTINKFVDGAAVKTVGKITFEIAKKVLDKMILVPEGKVCEEMISMYQTEGIITEPAGALAVSALEKLATQLKNKTVVCVVSGGNNDISRYPEIMERSLMYRGLKHYFIIEFSQRPGALRNFLDKTLGANDDITLFEYIKKSNKESGPALVGIELKDKNDLKPLLKRMKTAGIKYEIIERDSSLFKFLI